MQWSDGIPFIPLHGTPCPHVECQQCIRLCYPNQPHELWYDNPSVCNQPYWLKHKITSCISLKMVCCSSYSGTNKKNWRYTTHLFFLYLSTERRYRYRMHVSVPRTIPKLQRAINVSFHIFPLRHSRLMTHV
jgi:hypothetical protein